LLRDLTSGKDAQVAAVRAVIAATHPDVLVLTGIDWDYDGRALTALNQGLATPYPFQFTARPNSGWASDLDLDGDGRRGGAGDAQGFGRFSGQGGVAVLSRLPILQDGFRDFSGFLWRDLPGSLIAGAALSPEVQAVQRLSSTVHWDLPVQLPNGRPLHLWIFAATPPVFDGPEDRNGRRNHDEAAFWLRYLEGGLPDKPADAPFVLMGDANLDPLDGDGRPEALRALLAHPALQDPAPRSAGAVQANAQGGDNATHRGDPGLDTADWPDAPGPGNLRVDYVLPAAALKVTGAGVYWPAPHAPGAAEAAAAARHHLVWADISLQ
jgi:hypothetical protein